MNKLLGNIIRVAVYTLAGFGMYVFVRNGWVVFFTLLIAGAVEGYLLQKESK